MGDAALLVDAADPHSARMLAQAVRASSRIAHSDVVGGVRSVLVTIEDGDLDRAARELGAIADMATMARTDHETYAEKKPAEKVVVLPASFDGPDLPAVAAASGLSEDEVVAELTEAKLEVQVVGFSPGFAYLCGLPKKLAGVPRRSVPREVVPAGSIALANGLAAVYPQATPGGWQIVGWTEAKLFDPDTAPFALLSPGDTVIFRRAAQGKAAALQETLGSRQGLVARRRIDRSPLQPPEGVTMGFEVEEPGLFTTIQDRGRIGLAHLGVPSAGPADPVSHRLANELVGNPPGSAALEVTAKGPSLRFHAPCYVAVVGGGLDVSLNGRTVETGRVIPVGAGQRLALGVTRCGARGYLAVAGGVVAPEVLNSASADTLSGLGAGALQDGDRLGVGARCLPLADHLRPTDRLAPERLGGGYRRSAEAPSDAGARRLRVVLGPDTEWFAERVADQLAQASFVVGEASNRVGLRLVPRSAASAITPAPGEMESRPVVTGAVQVPPSGEPIVLLPDHATLGGYPVAAVVIWADLRILGQCRPGDHVRFEPVDWAEAARARFELERQVADAVTGHYPVVSA